MSPAEPLRVRHTLSFKGDPLMTIDNLPGEGCELYPHQARALADALREAATHCEELHSHVRRFAPVRREYPL